MNPIAEVTARQFEWRLRYPARSRKFKSLADVDNWLRKPEPGDLYAVNELHVPTGRTIVIHLRSADVQHAFFVPNLRVKQDAVPGLVIPIMFEVLQPGPVRMGVCRAVRLGPLQDEGPRRRPAARTITTPS